MTSALILMGFFFASGCDLPSRPPIERTPVDETAISDPGEEIEVVEPPQESFIGDWETWEVYRIGGQNVGYRHIVADSTLDQQLLTKGDSQVRYALQDEIFFRKGHLRFVQSLSQSSLETRQGELKSFDADLRVGPIQTLLSGNVAGRTLPVETVRGTVRSSRAVPWDPTSRGLLARYQSLRRNPMESGETRNLRYLLPWRYELAVAELVCSGQSAIPLLDGDFQLLTEITCRTRVDDQIVAEHMIWTDEKGVVQKTLESGSRLESYRTDRAIALASLWDPMVTPGAAREPKSEGAGTDADLLPGERRHVAAVDVDGWIERPSEATRVAFSVTLQPWAGESESSGEILSMSEAPNQLVRKVDGVFQVLVTRQPENRSGFAEFTQKPTDADLASTTIFNHQEPLVDRMTAAFADRPAKEAALEATKVVHGVLSLSDDGVIERASLIASRARGASIQHSILLTAMLRSMKIPARLAIGLQYKSFATADDSEATKSTRSRMELTYWTLAFIDDQWIALDPTAGTLASADRITLLTSRLEGPNEYTDIGRAFELLGRLDIRVLKAQYDQSDDEPK